VEKKKGKRYTPEFKQRTLNLLRSTDKSIAQIGRELGVPHCTLQWWLKYDRGNNMAKQAKDAPRQKPRVEQLEAEIRRLQKENKRLEMEREILKAAATWFAKESE
jgi:transposase